MAENGNGGLCVTWPKLGTFTITLLTAIFAGGWALFAHHSQRPHNGAVTHQEMELRVGPIESRQNRIEDKLDEIIRLVK